MTNTGGGHLDRIRKGRTDMVRMDDYRALSALFTLVAACGVAGCGQSDDSAVAGTGGSAGAGGAPADCSVPPVVRGAIDTRVALLNFDQQPVSASLVHKVDVDVVEGGWRQGETTPIAQPT
jgi:hypothetical protein